MFSGEKTSAMAVQIKSLPKTQRDEIISKIKEIEGLTHGRQPGF